MRFHRVSKSIFLLEMAPSRQISSGLHVWPDVHGGVRKTTQSLGTSSGKLLGFLTCRFCFVVGCGSSSLLFSLFLFLSPLLAVFGSPSRYDCVLHLQGTRRVRMANAIAGSSVNLRFGVLVSCENEVTAARDTTYLGW